MIIDGSYGEGGGQIVRTCLALAMITGKAFRLENIRGGRRKPGLLRQHLTAVQAASEICKAKIKGAELHSREIVFEPNEIIAGEYEFRIGTAGSTTLVLQTVLPALMTIAAPATLVLEGGTHNSHAPPFDFIEKTFLPLIRQMGPGVEVNLEKHGFFPAGGGQLTAKVKPVESLNAIELEKRGRLIDGRAKSVSAHLPGRIGEQEMEIVCREMQWPGESCQPQIVKSDGPGNAVMIELEYEHVTLVFTGFGAKGVPLATVANEAIRQAQDYLASDVGADPYLADQLLLPMAVAGRGSFTTGALSHHTRTNIDIIQRFLDIEFEINRIDDRKWQVRIENRSIED